MPLIDDRGRVFGKINLIDLALLVFALLLVPLGYGAYLLFRTPPPQLLGVSPNPLPFAKGEQRVVLKGEHLASIPEGDRGSERRAELPGRQPPGGGNCVRRTAAWNV
jgi:hypothetical protein